MARESPPMMRHGAELHAGASAGFTLLPECFRILVRHRLGFRIVTKDMHPICLGMPTFCVVGRTYLHKIAWLQ
jgi:hypothetical protein